MEDLDQEDSPLKQEDEEARDKRMRLNDLSNENKDLSTFDPGSVTNA